MTNPQPILSPLQQSAAFEFAFRVRQPQPANPSASVALSAPECVAGFGLLSGRILPELEPHVASKERRAKLRAFIGHGEYDTSVSH